MSDVFDRASRLETEERERLIAARLNRPAELPDEDERGRYCLDCGDTIPPARVLSVGAVRCVECQQGKEHREAVRVGHRY
jgi:phage/conjugal plasmid C-4 type zinc finger TraR family protein